MVAWCPAEKQMDVCSAERPVLAAGARSASAAPGDRKGKGGSVPRTDVVAALQAAAARTPLPPSRAGMPAAPAAGTGLTAAAAAPDGAKPKQAAASVPLGSVSANAAVLVSGGHAGCSCRSCDGWTAMIAVLYWLRHQ